MAPELRNVPTIKAYDNPAFLAAPTARPMRVMCELYEPMQRLEAQGVDNYFMVLGSHTLMHPEERARHQAELEEQLKRDGPEEEMEALEARIRFAKKMSPMDKYYAMAMDLGYKLAEWNRDRVAKGLPSYHVCTGGGPGVMEAANRGARNAGAVTLGFGATRPEWGSLNKYVSKEGAFQFHYFFMRKFWLAYKCMGLVVLPGGIGVMDELFELLVLVQSKKIRHRMPIVLLGEDHWRKAINFDYLLECGMMTQKHMDSVVFKDSAEEAFQHLVNSVHDGDKLGEAAEVEQAKRRRMSKSPSAPRPVPGSSGGS